MQVQEDPNKARQWGTAEQSSAITYSAFEPVRGESNLSSIISVLTHPVEPVNFTNFSWLVAGRNRNILRSRAYGVEMLTNVPVARPRT